MATETLAGNDRLQTNRQTAVSRLHAYLETPGEKALRYYQVDVMDSLAEHFASGGTAGYIQLPTGAGKTHIMIEVARVLGLGKTLFLSPMKNISRQTSRKAQVIDSNLGIGTLFGGERETGAPIINALYQSVDTAIELQDINPKGIDLVVCDEMHTGLGEVRHTIYRQFPNALLIGLTATTNPYRVNEYLKKGDTSPDERWLGLFQNRIHEMSIEEAMERDILAHADMHLLKTLAQVANVHFTGDDYDMKALERSLRQIGRDNLVVAMLKGVDVLPSDVAIPSDQLHELKTIYEQIKGKKTAIFGLSIRHIEELAERLSDLGLMVSTVHGKMKDEEVVKAFEKYENGGSQIILGVDMLGLGWDSPQTEVGIFMQPHRSVDKVIQEFGRLLRPSPETGKTHATAIQLVDRFEQGQQPILLPGIFDRNFVMRNLAFKSRTQKKRGVDSERETTSVHTPPLISVSGMRVDTSFWQVTTQQILRDKLLSDETDVKELYNLITAMASEMVERNIEATSLIDCYRIVAAHLPGQTRLDLQHKILELAKNGTSEESAMAKVVFTFLSLKSILSSIDLIVSKSEYSYQDEDKKAHFAYPSQMIDEMIQTALETVYEHINDVNVNANTAAQVNIMTHNEIESMMAKEFSVPVAWVKSGIHFAIFHEMSQYLRNSEQNVTSETQTDFIQRLATKYNVSQLSVEEVLLAAMQDSTDDLEMASSREEMRDKLEDAMESAHLSERERKTLELRFGLTGVSPKSLEEVGDEFGVSRERIRQIEAKALRKMRRPIASRGLRNLL